MIKKLEETAKKEHISSVQTYDDSPQSSALKRRCELAKRLIGSYTSSESSSETTITTTKPTLTADVVVAPKQPASVVVNSSKLSADLQSRLNFGGGSNNGHHQPVVKFNEGSLSSTKVIVSSTTLDDDEDTKRTFSSKRKLIGRDEIDDDEEDQSEYEHTIIKINKPISYKIYSHLDTLDRLKNVYRLLRYQIRAKSHRH